MLRNEKNGAMLWLWPVLVAGATASATIAKFSDLLWKDRCHGLGATGTMVLELPSEMYFFVDLQMDVLRRLRFSTPWV